MVHRSLIGAWASASLALALVTGCGGPSVEVQTSSPATASDPLDAIPAAELFRRGVILGRHGDFVRAEQYLLAARNRGFDEDRVIPALMEVCVRASRLSAALGYAEPYLESHPAQWPLRILVGSIHLGLGQLSDARRHLERAIRDGATTREGEARPEPAEAHYLLGIVMREQSEIIEARVHFARYAELEPEGTHSEEVRAILAEPEPRQATPVPPSVRPASVPVRLPSPAPTNPDGVEPATRPAPAAESRETASRGGTP
jgi:tetratricopeptide (TPR) repeat protein